MSIHTKGLRNLGFYIMMLMSDIFLYIIVPAPYLGMGVLRVFEGSEGVGSLKLRKLEVWSGLKLVSL